MTVSLSPMARLQFTISGAPLAGGRLYTYAAGTTTKLATYTDATGLTPNTNPVILDTQGFCDLWLTDGQAYKLALSPSTDTDPPTNTFWIRDNISNALTFNPTFHNITLTGTINNITITPPATGATLTLANNSTFATAGPYSITLTATANSSVTLPTGGTLARNDQATDAFGALTDITTNNATTVAHGFLPKLSGNPAQFLNGIGGWAAAPAQSVLRSARTSNTILAGTDNASLVDITSGTFTQTFTAAATLGAGWYVWVRNSGTGDITLDPNASELIDGLTSYNMYTGETRLIQCDGSAFTSVVVSQFNKLFSTSGTFIKPPGYMSFLLTAIGGGAGGCSGFKGAAGTTRVGGAGAGSGSWGQIIIPSSGVASSETVSIGAAGTGGSAVSTNSTTGTLGTNGGDTSFGSWYRVKGGSAAAGPSNTDPYSGGVGAVAGFLSYAGHAGGDGSGTAQNVGVSSGADPSPAGGGSGGGITSGNSLVAGANGGAVGNLTTTGGFNGNIAGGTGGAIRTAGNPGNVGTLTGGSGGGGGGASDNATPGGTGGVGGFPGGGGGGGGSALNTTTPNSGAGGNGGGGSLYIQGVS